MLFKIYEDNLGETAIILPLVPLIRVFYLAGDCRMELSIGRLAPIYKILYEGSYIAGQKLASPIAWRPLEEQK